MQETIEVRPRIRVLKHKFETVEEMRREINAFRKKAKKRVVTNWQIFHAGMSVLYSMHVRRDGKK